MATPSNQILQRMATAVLGSAFKQADHKAVAECQRRAISEAGAPMQIGLARPIGRQPYYDCYAGPKRAPGDVRGRDERDDYEPVVLTGSQSLTGGRVLGWFSWFGERVVPVDQVAWGRISQIFSGVPISRPRRARLV